MAVLSMLLLKSSMPSGVLFVPFSLCGSISHIALLFFELAITMNLSLVSEKMGKES